MAGNNAAERLSSNSVYALELEGVGRQFGALVALADINLRVGAGRHWLRSEVRDSNGKLLLMSSPLYINFPEQTPH